MITTFNSDDEKKFLYDLLWRGVMSTDLIFNEVKGLEEDLQEYKRHLVKFRQKCFEFLEEKDPNELVIEKYFK